MESVRPFVLPKLREERERERSRKKSAKKRSIKDVVVEDEFEVSIFLTETETRHSILHKQKHFRDKTQTKLTSNSSKLTGASRDVPIDLDSDGKFTGAQTEDSVQEVPLLRVEDGSDDEGINLDDIPAARGETSGDVAPPKRPSKRRRDGAQDLDGPDTDPDGVVQPIQANSSSEHDLFVHGSDSDSDSDSDGDGDGGELTGSPPSKRRRKGGDEVEQQDDKKKLAVDISYEGFAIYGRVLCLVIKRRGGGGGGGGRGSRGRASASGASQPGPLGGQAMMENWITSTQMQEAVAEEDMS